MLVLIAAATGCGVRQNPAASALVGPSSARSDCALVASDYHRVVREAGVGSAFGQPIPGAPWLRVLRGWSQWPVETEAQRRQWVRAAAVFGRRVWSAELRNLPDQTVARALSAAMMRCAQAQQSEVMTERQWQALRAASRFESDYVSWQRWLGVYPLSRLGLRMGVSAWQREFLSDYGPRADHRDWPRWQARFDEGVVHQVLDRAPRLPGLEPPGFGELHDWLIRYSPRLRLEIDSTADLPGRPVWGQALAFDLSDPVMHFQLLPGLDRGERVWQLVFTVWFAGRPPESATDPYAGALDGIVWRVTLDQQGEVRMRDSIHPCGCYHLLFPPERVRAAAGLAEPPLLPETLPAAQAVELVVRSGDHMIVDVRLVMADESTGTSIRVAPYSELLSMSTPDGGARSLFDSRGLVPASERPERWYLWPSGVRSPGAMRVWGRHATAFVGTRHFDDPNLFGRLVVDASR